MSAEVGAGRRRWLYFLAVQQSPEGGPAASLTARPTAPRARNDVRGELPHGPEPCRRRDLECPGGFSGGRLNSNGVASVSYGDLSEPSVSGNA